MRRYTGGKKRDLNEPEIVAALRSVGAQVWHVSGTGLPDVLVWFRQRFFVLECKSARGKLTKAQAAIIWPVVRTPEEALIAIGAQRSHFQYYLKAGTRPAARSTA